jgi:hypothetical protein
MDMIAKREGATLALELVLKRLDASPDATLEECCGRGIDRLILKEQRADPLLSYRQARARVIKPENRPKLGVLLQNLGTGPLAQAPVAKALKSLADLGGDDFVDSWVRAFDDL